ncbi:MAG: hypothetical protein EOO48_08855 [Flavobacterium sp.]|nr:MAG: hypothetical protein EOO48_08855 [Flavobacterium sp.]
MGTINNNSGAQNSGQRNFQTPNQDRTDRRDMSRHQYADHDQETNDANFESGKEKNGEMDFRDKRDNLESQK